MSDDATRAKMMILNLTADEIVEAINLLPGPSDWRELAVGAAGLQKDMLKISDAVLERMGWVPMGGTLDINVAAYSYKCTPEQAGDVARTIYRDQWGVLQKRARNALKKAYGDRPHNPVTMELIFDDREIP